MPNGVSCSVSNCSFWGEGNLCAASRIAIEIDAHSKRKFEDAEFAEEGFAEHQDVAGSSKTTCCLTFKPKE
ncbi:DUF1540 domain-containing protein [Cohnella sp. AR92]|uniref:DUF1540 domain-containing protein n=1 Tax=Cohnella sp. AR92 TaxID=648716 RepID=UPI000F8D76FF|nr:DUF1540 domain-containing protein [Cohnella sp. AR92]RUS48468.1 DUF1540 domain-containing protein [Cohnella sp. AR92]